MFVHQVLDKGSVMAGDFLVDRQVSLNSCFVQSISQHAKKSGCRNDGQFDKFLVLMACPDPFRDLFGRCSSGGGPGASR